MSGRRFKAGDIALLDSQLEADQLVGLRVGGGWWTTAGMQIDRIVNAARPLVLIDPANSAEVARLADAFCSARWSHHPDSEECDPLTRSSMQQALDEYLDPTPPKPDEPTGLGAVVEDAHGLPWVRTAHAFGRDWSRAETHATWDRIDAVRVLSDGMVPNA